MKNDGKPKVKVYLSKLPYELLEKAYLQIKAKEEAEKTKEAAKCS